MAVTTREAAASERAFYGENVEVVAPATLEELGDLVRDAEREGRPLVPAGAGAHAGLANPPAPNALIVSMRAFDSVALYEPDDFTIGVGAGMTMGELHALLREQRQELPIDVAERVAHGTAGGLVACRPVGPRQGAYGPLTSFLLGAEGVRGGGRPFKAGGQVVKNVAGYPLDKLLCGSLGAAGFLSRVNFKLRPAPKRRRVHWVGFDDEGAAWRFAGALRDSSLEPAAELVLSGDLADEGRKTGIPFPNSPHFVAWVFEGAPSTVEWLEGRAEKVLPGERPASESHGDDVAAAFLDFAAGVSDPSAPIDDDVAIVRMSLLPTSVTEPARWASDVRGLSRLSGGTCADVRTGLVTVRLRGESELLATGVETLRDTARAEGGSARLLYLPPALRADFDHWLTGEPNAALSTRFLEVFDPHGVFARPEAKR